MCDGTRELVCIAMSFKEHLVQPFSFFKLENQEVDQLEHLSKVL